MSTKFHVVISDRCAILVIGVEQTVEAENRTDAIAKAMLIASECELEEPSVIEVTEEK
ncbi:MAG TPA: hypothetical protein VGY31_03395 [Terriglobia bacterium]|nr:hypothetical protein [Terriglobia bacterium]